MYRVSTIFHTIAPPPYCDGAAAHRLSDPLPDNLNPRVKKEFAEDEGFEPPIRFHVCHVSSVVH